MPALGHEQTRSVEGSRGNRRQHLLQVTALPTSGLEESVIEQSAPERSWEHPAPSGLPV